MSKVLKTVLLRLIVSAIIVIYFSKRNDVLFKEIVKIKNDQMSLPTSKLFQIAELLRSQDVTYQLDLVLIPSKLPNSIVFIAYALFLATFMLGIFFIIFIKKKSSL